MTYRNLLSALGFLVISSVAHGQARCESILEPTKTDAEVLGFIETHNSHLGGEYNAYLMRYFEANLEHLSPAGAVLLVKAVVPEGSMSRSSQWTPFVTRDFAREKMVQIYTKHAQDRLTEKELEYFSDLLKYGL